MESEASGNVELILIRRATALWPAIEAAQYARLVDFDRVASEPERRRISEFLDAFQRCTEDWEEIPDQNKSAMFVALDGRLGALAQLGLHIYAGTTERDFQVEGERLAMPVAVLHVGHAVGDVRSVNIPGTLS